MNNPDEKDYMEKGTEVKELLSQMLARALFADLVDMLGTPEGVHNINTKLFSMSFPQLGSL